MAGNYVNLNDAGVLTQSGQGYEANSEDQFGESRNFLGRMDASKQGLKGSAGNTFTGVSDMSGGNLTQLANLIAEQAVRAVRTENTLLTADDDSTSAQQTSVAGMESHASVLSRGINA